MSTEEFTACLIMRGLSVTDFDKFSYGMLLNYAFSFDRLKRMASGENVPDTDSQYGRLKQVQPLVEERFRNGQISLERYEAFQKLISEN